MSSTKGGVGCTVVTAAIGLLAARTRQTLLVDFGGDLPAVLGLDLRRGHDRLDLPASDLGVLDWLCAERPPADALGRLERTVHDRLSVLPAGTGSHGASAEADPDRAAVLAGVLAGEGRLVVVDLGTAAARYPSLLARAVSSLHVTSACYLALRRGAAQGCDRVVLVRERGRALSSSDVSRALGTPVSVTLEVDPAVARAVDAGLLRSRLPRSLRPLDVLLPPDPARTAPRAGERSVG